MIGGDELTELWNESYFCDFDLSGVEGNEDENVDDGVDFDSVNPASLDGFILSHGEPDRASRQR